MDSDHRSFDSVRADLVARLARLEALGAAARPADLAVQLDAIRRIATRHGLMPAAGVARLLESAVGRGQRGALINNGLAVLRDAVACDRDDAEACVIFAAACSVRLTA